MMPSDNNTRAKSPEAASSWLSAHNFFALLIAGILSVLIIGLVQNELANWVKSPTSFGDVLFLGLIFDVGLVLGYLINRTIHTRMVNWIWIPGLFWMILGVREVLQSDDPRWHLGCSAAQTVVNAFFIGSHKCGDGEQALYGLFFTMPALGLAGCSIGAWVALHRVRVDRHRVRPVHLT